MGFPNYDELLAAAHASGSVGEAVVARECEEAGISRAEAIARFTEALDVMEAAVSRGLSGEARSRSGLAGGDARTVIGEGPRLAGGEFTEAIAAAIAVAEVNASMGRVVAAPTGGASGVLPGVLLTIAARAGASRERQALALACAGGIGGIIAAKASLSGAASGCQAEIGAGAAMAAAAAVELLSGTPEQVGHAASLALQGLLGLVCDPVGGLVEVPCVARNATGAAVALAAAEMALAGVAFPIPFDEVASAMGSVGRSLPPSLRETALGGLAVTPTGKRLAADS
ncbi:MAG: L-serine ammonia-lyase, iron-sulfur-dependent, subunit alpha [Coriobacteriia bacterium]|nr:L-serine ammonia-lyase, iron-sulfur-dependent, subunit alpha [Coriobacteriia bacterium]